MPAKRSATEAARHLLRTATPAESLLWPHLRGYRLDGHKFRRQHPIGDFIVDFCCRRDKLVVEVDGGIHRARRSADAARDGLLRHPGYQVLRFPNDAVLKDAESVITEIRRALASPPPSASPSPSPEVRARTPSRRSSDGEGAWG